MGGGGGHSFIHAEGGGGKVLGSFSAELLSFSHTKERGGAKSFHLFKGGM